MKRRTRGSFNTDQGEEKGTPATGGGWRPKGKGNIRRKRGGCQKRKVLKELLRKKKENTKRSPTEICDGWQKGKKPAGNAWISFLTMGVKQKKEKGRKNDEVYEGGQGGGEGFRPDRLGPTKSPKKGTLLPYHRRKKRRPKKNTGQPTPGRK